MPRRKRPRLRARPSTPPQPSAAPTRHTPLKHLPRPADTTPTRPPQFHPAARAALLRGPGRLAPVLELPLPAAAAAVSPARLAAGRDGWNRARECAEAHAAVVRDWFGAAQPEDVFVKHWENGCVAAGAQIRRRTRARGGEEEEDGEDAGDGEDGEDRGTRFAANDYLLTIAVLEAEAEMEMGGQVIVGDLSLAGGSVPLVVVALVEVGLLSICYVRERGVLQFNLRLVAEEELGSHERFLLQRFVPWMYNFQMSGGEIVEQRERYGKEWVFDQVRRLEGDDDACEYQPYLDRVDRNTELNVVLRPYQKRAVAWMLSRELGKEVELAPDVRWERSEELRTRCVFASIEGVHVVGDVLINPFYGTIQASGDGNGGDACRMERQSRGGLLCDEMGLGKTVELMQLVLCNKLEGSAGNKATQGSLANLEDICSCCGRRCSRNKASASRSLVRCVECGNVAHQACLPQFPKAARKTAHVCRFCVNRMMRLSRDETLPAELPQAKATLVVIPTTLLLQWRQEIERHVKDALKIEIFQGLRKSGYICQRRLLSADVVLTTYEALRADIATSQALRTPRTGLRRAQKYAPTPIPLLPILWHRIAFDESQMLGANAASRTAEMAAYLHGTYRWCVTGTPISRSLDDAVRMFDILKMRCAHREMDWASFVRPTLYAEDEKQVKAALRQVMWRSSKDDVEGGELNLPPQITEVVETSFGPVERYHYASLQGSVRNTVRRYRHSSEMHTVSTELLTMLRQGSCHPEVGISGRRLMSQATRRALRSVDTRPEDAAAKAAKRAASPLDMNEVLNALVVKAKVECEEALRSMVASSNGLAAVCWLEYSLLPPSSPSVEGLVSAVKLYRDVLSLAHENRNVVRLDSIQRMHILFNLSEALESVSDAKKRISSLPSPSRTESLAKLEALGRTLRESELTKDVDNLKLEYISEARAELVVAADSYKSVHEKLGAQPLIQYDKSEDEESGAASDDGGDFFFSSAATTTNPEVAGGREQPLPPPKEQREELYWWHLAVAALLEKETRKQESFMSRIIQKLLDAIPGGGIGSRTLASRLNSLYSVPLVVESELRVLQEARDALHEGIQTLPGAQPPTEADVLESGQCRGCRENGIGPLCKHCRAERLFVEVERRLYYLRDDDPDEMGVYGKASGASRTATGEAKLQSDPKAIVSLAINPRSSNSSSLPGQSSGLRFQGEAETVLKALAAVLRAEKDEQVLQTTNDWFSRFELLKKELSEAKVWIEAQRSLLARMDEVNMALTRLSVLGDNENLAEMSEIEQRHRLPRDSLPTLNVQFTAEKAAAMRDFGKKRGGLVFLQSLQNPRQDGKDDCKESSTNTLSVHIAQCAVCLGGLEDKGEVAVFVCGHVFCCDCTLLMIRRAPPRARISTIACPSCRVRCPVDEINFTRGRPAATSGATGTETLLAESDAKGAVIRDAKASSAQPRTRKRRRSGENVVSSPLKIRRVKERSSTFYDARAAVIGLIGAKSSAIVRTIRGIWQQDASAKILIFSEWHEVISLISRALHMNRIEHTNTAATRTQLEFARGIDRFKHSVSGSVLLLPLRRAGAGLNLTEAQHVILVEPSMDVRLELQAVGRVHRIGQQKETFVHRMVIENTVEGLILSLGDAFRRGGKGGGIHLADVMGGIGRGADSGDSDGDSGETTAEEAEDVDDNNTESCAENG